MYDLWLIVAIVVMFIGALGTFLPVIPGIPLIFLAMVGYGFSEGFVTMTPLFLLVNLLIVIVAVAIDYLGTAWGAKRFGASSSGAWGAVIGGVVGLLVLGPLGIVAGPFLGAVIGELMKGRSIDFAIEAGIGTMIGLVGATVVRLFIAFGMIVAFIWRIW
ncbi:DUF456 domain-containing protein [Heliorestis acidaminivorans]|uniref:DUF456 domain-containing protein n=1 Tax=Heliorestis acidaminivorans TaxID=553427 RepID=A0A6I0EV35_9FIRM|nr:DUF456 domain-containing protein [Heliorestis acidaminivorans]KAB2954234.1 DUF456 domain-containing protein [Heliorestis acidaminivorans]